MKKIVVPALMLSLLFGAAGAASAQPYGYGHDNHYSAHRNVHHDWRRGGRIERSDWARGRPVDYRAYHLRQPPRGYAWRNVDGQYVLAAVTTGIIADIMLNSR